MRKVHPGSVQPGEIQPHGIHAREIETPRKVHVEHGLNVGFPHRSAEFAEGVEIGVLVALMATGAPRFIHRVSPASVEQARDLAAPLGYRLVVSDEADGLVQVVLSRTSLRPRLSLVAS